MKRRLTAAATSLLRNDKTYNLPDFVDTAMLIKAVNEGTGCMIKTEWEKVTSRSYKKDINEIKGRSHGFTVEFIKDINNDLNNEDLDIARTRFLEVTLDFTESLAYKHLVKIDNACHETEFSEREDMGLKAQEINGASSQTAFKFKDGQDNRGKNGTTTGNMVTAYMPEYLKFDEMIESMALEMTMNQSGISDNEKVTFNMSYGDIRGTVARLWPGCMKNPTYREEHADSDIDQSKCRFPPHLAAPSNKDALFKLLESEGMNIVTAEEESHRFKSVYLGKQTGNRDYNDVMPNLASSGFDKDVVEKVLKNTLTSENEVHSEMVNKQVDGESLLTANTSINGGELLIDLSEDMMSSKLLINLPEDMMSSTKIQRGKSGEKSYCKHHVKSYCKYHDYVVNHTEEKCYLNPAVAAEY
jgi:hypothetical protein